jgi:AcrR family transcriptional regulator
MRQGLDSSRAPARGKYDRRSTRSDRLAVQHEQIMSAARARLAGSDSAEVTVAYIVEKTGLGRNTVYSHFATMHQLVQAVATESWEAVSAHWESAEVDMGIPLGAAEQLTQRWFRAVEQVPNALRIVLQADRARLAGRVTQEIAAFRDGGVRAGAFRHSDELCLLALGAAVLAALEYCLDRPMARTGGPAFVGELLIRALR